MCAFTATSQISSSSENSLAQILSQALQHHQAGRLPEASAGYQEVLSRNPQHSDALHLLGVVAQQMDKLDLAIELMRQAVSINPSVAHYHHNLGNTYLKAQQALEAVNCYRQAVLLKPDYAEAHFGMGNALFELQQCEIAVEAYQAALAINPSFAAGYSQLGRAFDKLDRIDDAIAAFRNATRLDDTQSAYFFNLGNLLLRKADYSAAIAAYNRVLLLLPNDLEALNNIALSYLVAEDIPLATSYYRRAITIWNGGRAEHSVSKEKYSSVHAEPLFRLGRLLEQSGETAEAVQFYKHALQLKPDWVAPYHQLGTACMKLNQFASAEDSLKRVLEISSKEECDAASSGLRLAAMVDLALCLDELDKSSEAQELYRQFLREQPQNASIHTNLGYSLLASGEYEEGWREHEWRWGAVGFPSKRKDFGRPLWMGQPLDGEKILLYWEQGYGDTLQFIRYVPLVAERGGRVILHVQPSLRKLLSQMPGVETFLSDGDPLPEFAWQCPLMSLPLAFHTTLRTIPTRSSYLVVPEDDSKRARQQWPGEGLRVGLAWSGSSTHKLDSLRSMSLDQLAPLASISNISLYSLQVGAGSKQIESTSLEIADVCSQYTDFADTAAFISGLDLVITVDTVIAHLAGALGIPVWILLPKYRTDWRWLRDRNDSPWYPTARLFRQERQGDWTGVIESVQLELQALATKYTATKLSQTVIS